MLGSRSFILFLVTVGLFEGVHPQAQVGAEVTVTLTPTLTVTVFDVQTTVINVEETRVVTQGRNIDVINTVYVDIPITFTQTITRRSLTPVGGQVTTSNVVVTNTQVSFSTQVIPVGSTVDFFSKGTFFRTRTSYIIQNSLITHTKCHEIEIVTVPAFANVVATQTEVIKKTTFVYSTLTTTQIIVPASTAY